MLIMNIKYLLMKVFKTRYHRVNIFQGKGHLFAQWSISDKTSIYKYILGSIKGKSGRVKSIKFIYRQESNLIKHISFYYSKGNIISCPPSLLPLVGKFQNSFSDSLLFIYVAPFHLVHTFTPYLLNSSAKFLCIIFLTKSALSSTKFLCNIIFTSLYQYLLIILYPSSTV